MRRKDESPVLRGNFFCDDGSKFFLCGIIKKKSGSHCETKEREQKKKQSGCGADIGWLGSGTRTGLPGCVSFVSS